MITVVYRLTERVHLVVTSDEFAEERAQRIASAMGFDFSRSVHLDTPDRQPGTHVLSDRTHTEAVSLIWHETNPRPRRRS